MKSTSRGNRAPHRSLVFTFAVLFVGSLLTVGTGQPAHANKQAARAAFLKGRDSFKSGDYRKALVQLAKAYRLKPHPVLLRYIGQTYYKLNDAKKAIAYFKRYLRDAPQAPDRAKIAEQVRELELVVSTDQETENATAGVPAVPAPEAPARPTPKRKPTVSLMPTGDDQELPDALQRESTTDPSKQKQPAVASPSEGGVGFMGVAKWVTLGLGIGGIAMGVVFNRMAASKASELEGRVVNDCPEGNPQCGGNPNKNNPVVAYQKDHHELLQGQSQNNAISIASFAIGGAAAAASVVLFVLDRKSSSERNASKSSSNVALSPSIGPGYYGVSSQVRF